MPNYAPDRSPTSVADRRFHARRYIVNMTFRVVLEHDPETGDYSAVCPELPGCDPLPGSHSLGIASLSDCASPQLTYGKSIRPRARHEDPLTVGIQREKVRHPVFK